VHLHKNKDIFAVGELPLKDFASALGLPGAPKVKFANKDAALNKKNVQHVPVHNIAENASDESSDEEETHMPSKVHPFILRRTSKTSSDTDELSSSLLSERNMIACSSERTRTSCQNITIE
jgi:ATP-dependent RNA helicase DDX10/DBP4